MPKHFYGYFSSSDNLTASAVDHGYPWADQPGYAASMPMAKEIYYRMEVYGPLRLMSARTGDKGGFVFVLGFDSCPQESIPKELLEQMEKVFGCPPDRFTRDEQTPLGSSPKANTDSDSTMGPDVNARQELTAKPVLICQLCFLLTSYLTVNPRLFHLRLWLIPITIWSIWSLCTNFAISDPSLTSVNFGICAVGISAAIKILELHWNNYGTCHTPEDARRDDSHAEFYSDTLGLILKHGLYIDALLAFITNMNTPGSSQNSTIFRDTFAITSNHNIRLPHPLLGALPLTVAVGLLVKNGLEFENYVITMLAAPLTWLPPSISPHSRPASLLKNEWPPLFDHPSRAVSLREFWSKRWQSAPRRSFLVAGGKPGRAIGGYIGRVVDKLIGFSSAHKINRNKRNSRAYLLGSRIGYVMGSFLVSGLIHDFGMWSMGKGMDFRRVTGYFLIQGVGVIVEGMLGLDKATKNKDKGTSRENDSTAKGKKIPSTHRLPTSIFARCLMKLWVFVWVVVPGTMMIEAWLKRGFGLITLVPYAYSPSRALFNTWNNFAFEK
ncbi:hypothetical protein FRC06_006272 [Ceratobasidium sp. 370]|nr:hypothetical protein FRC06_006272 [Ceratobasidium sp. 370]